MEFVTALLRVSEIENIFLSALGQSKIWEQLLADWQMLHVETSFAYEKNYSQAPHSLICIAADFLET